MIMVLFVGLVGLFLIFCFWLAYGSPNSGTCRVTLRQRK